MHSLCIAHLPTSSVTSMEQQVWPTQHLHLLRPAQAVPLAGQQQRVASPGGREQPAQGQGRSCILAQPGKGSRAQLVSFHPVCPAIDQSIVAESHLPRTLRRPDAQAELHRSRHCSSPLLLQCQAMTAMLHSSWHGLAWPHLRARTASKGHAPGQALLIQASGVTSTATATGLEATWTAGSALPGPAWTGRPRWRPVCQLSCALPQ